ncbi:hypothetical protein SAMN02745116_01993 [Pilibacter termitis]|uniref:Uncharacterized protein n=1 Tax=Pilibacter termitis TaxID=263852 RepID=A0A1T4PZ43_9ENTE|nr:hypothetical protein [Pilibacter termitis]SJZ96755.1 hypothetical protein SAMN02745116_01993 [Pilibacter termitis]
MVQLRQDKTRQDKTRQDKTRQDGYKLKNFAIIFIASMFLLLPLIYMRGVLIGNDTMIHFNRFYDAMMNLKNGHFPSVSLYGFLSVGRICNALYGEGFAYICGGLLLLLKSWSSFQLVTSFVILFVAGSGMFLTGRKAGLSDKFSLIASLVYLCCYTTNLWTIHTAYTGFCSAVLPFVVMCGLDFIQKREKQVNILFLSFMMGILLNTHNFTAMLGVVVLIPFFIVGWVKSKERAKYLFSLFIAVVFSTLLSLRVFYSMIKLFKENNLYTVRPELNLAHSSNWFTIQMPA